MAHDPIESLQVKRGEGYLVLTAPGPGIEEGTRDALYAAAEGLGVEPGPRGMVLDLGNVRVFKSIGIGILVSFQKKVREAGGRLVLCRLDPEVARTFRLTKVDQLLEIRPTEREAVAALRGRSGSWLSRILRR